MRFECTIMRAIDTSSPSAESEGEASEEWVEMRRPLNKMGLPHQPVGAAGVADGLMDHHTDEYWKRGGKDAGKSKDDWVKEEEELNRGHRSNESFAVLNELVVVCSPAIHPTLIFPYSIFLGFDRGI